MRPIDADAAKKAAKAGGNGISSQPGSAIKVGAGADKDKADASSDPETVEFKAAPFAGKISEKPVLACPAMNTVMWQQGITQTHLDALRERGAEVRKFLFIAIVISMSQKDKSFSDCYFNKENQKFIKTKLQIVGPGSKLLACGDEGIGAMAEVSEIVAALRKKIGNASGRVV